MDPNDKTRVVADETLSPSVTEDGASPSDAADSLEESLAEALAKDFAEEHGDAEPGQPEAQVEPEVADEPAQQPEEEADDADDDQFHIPDAQFKALPDGVKKRIGHLNTRWKKAERELQEVQKDLPQLRDAHERFNKVSGFLTKNQIEPQNVTLAFEAMAQLSRGDYTGFLKSVKPWMDLAAQAAGEAISPDLQEKVDGGYITEEVARELTQARVQAQTQKGQTDRYRQQAEQQRTAQAAQGEQQRIVQTITRREQEIIASDPDYARKKPVIERVVQLAIRNGQGPRTADEALALLNDAYALAQTAAPAATPRPTAPRPTATSPGRGAPEPKTLQEALELSLVATAPR